MRPPQRENAATQGSGGKVQRRSTSILCGAALTNGSCRKPTGGEIPPIRPVEAEAPSAPLALTSAPSAPSSLAVVDATPATSVSEGCPSTPTPASTCDGVRVLLRGFDDGFVTLRCENGMSSGVTIPRFRSCYVGNPSRHSKSPPFFACSNTEFSVSDAEKGIDAIRALLDPCFAAD